MLSRRYLSMDRLPVLHQLHVPPAEDGEDGEKAAAGVGLGVGLAGGMLVPRRYVRCLALCGSCLLLMLLAYLPVLHAPPPRPDAAHSAAIVGWARNRSRDLRLYVMPDNDTTVLQPSWVCPEDGPYLLVIVCSALDHRAARSAIRDTWGSVHRVGNSSIHLAFLVGQPAAGDSPNLQSELESEAARHGDIIQERFVDSYYNLTLKTVFMLKWVRTHCPKVRYLMKTDDDMFVNLESLVLLLRVLPPKLKNLNPSSRGSANANAIRGSSASSHVLVGALICGAKPITNSANKWYAPRYMYNGRVYPNYLSGTGYVMSGDCTLPLYLAALHTPFFHLEDVFLTGMCARKAGLHPRDHPAFSYSKRRPDACVLKDRTVVTSHRMEQSALRQVWAAMQQPSLNCTSSKVQSLQKPSTRPMGNKITSVRRPGYRCV